MIRKLLVIVLAVTMWLPAMAQLVTQDNLIFRLYSPSDGTPYAVVAGNTIEENARVEIPASVTNDDATYPVTTIGDEAFKNCAYLNGVTIPESVTKIGKHAFYYCTGMSRIEIPASVKLIDEFAFFGCKNLMAADIPNGVETIGTKAFSFCALRNVNIPASVKTIGSSVFIYNQETIDEFVIADADEPLSMYVTADDHNYMLSDSEVESFYLGRNIQPTADADGKIDPSLSIFISRVGVSSATTIRNLTIGGKVTDIWYGLFRDFKDIKTVAIPASVKTIGNEAFSMCAALQKVVFGNGLESIGDNAFSACRMLSSLNLPDGLQTIGQAAFAYCSGVSSLTLPGSIKSFGDYAFYNCTSLAEIRYKTTEPVEAKNELFVPDTYADAVLFVAPGGASGARTTEPWKYFQNIEEDASLGVEAVAADIDFNAPVEVFDLNGVMVGTSLSGLAKGVYVVRQGEAVSKVAL